MITPDPDPRHRSERAPQRFDTSQWSVEHYGFDATHESTVPSSRAPSRRVSPVPQPAAGPQATRPRRSRSLLAAGALTLGLIAGAGGVAVAQAADDPVIIPDGDGVQISRVFHDGPRGPR